MRIRTETDNGTLVVQPEGRIDGAAAIDFRRSMEAVIGDDCEQCPGGLQEHPRNQQRRTQRIPDD